MLVIANEQETFFFLNHIPKSSRKRAWLWQKEKEQESGE